MKVIYADVLAVEPRHWSNWFWAILTILVPIATVAEIWFYGV